MPYLVVALLCTAYLYPFTRMVCEAPDAGVFLNGADLLTQGAWPSLDFVEPQGPGSFVWLAIFFRLFGSSLATARVVLVATGVGMALLTFYLSRRLGATGLFATVFVVTMSLPLLPINSPHYDTNLLALAALALFLIAWDQPSASLEPPKWPLAGTGILCGLVTTMIQQKGICLIASLLLAILWLRRPGWQRALWWLALPFAAVALLPFLVFSARHHLPDLLLANYIWPAEKYNELNVAPYAFPLARDLQWDFVTHGRFPLLLARDLTANVPFLIVAAMPCLLPLAARLGGRRWLLTPLLPYWLFGYALWFGELHRLDIGHLRNGVMLMAVLFFSICEASGKASLRSAAFALTVFLALVGSAGLLVSLQPGDVIATRRGELLAGDNAPLLQFLQSHTKPGEEVFVYPYQPLYYFVEDLRNPTRYSYLQYHLHTERQFREAVLDLDRKRVQLVVFDRVFSGNRFRDIFPAYQHPDPSQLIMEPYLDSHYRLLSRLGRFTVLERKADTPTEP